MTDRDTQTPLRSVRDKKVQYEATEFEPESRPMPLVNKSSQIQEIGKKDESINVEEEDEPLLFSSIRK